MTVPNLTFSEFKDLLNKNGYEVESNDYWDQYNRITFKKDGESFPLQFQEVYYFPFVVKACLSLGIDPPEDHKTCFDQYQLQKRKEKE